MPRNKTNANVERVIRTSMPRFTIEEELWFIEGIEYSIDHLNNLLRKYIEKYNFVRPHYETVADLSLGYMTPAEVTTSIPQFMEIKKLILE